MPELITDPPPPAPLIVYEPNEGAIAQVRETFADLLADPDICKTPEGYDRVKAALKVVVPMRTTIEKARVQQKAASLEWGRKVDTEARRLTGLVLTIETPLKERKEAVDAEAELAARKIVEEQMAKEKAEADRILAEKAAAERAQREAEAKEREAERAKLAAERAEWEAEQAKMREANRIEEEKRQEAARVEWARLAEERRQQKAEEGRIAADRAALRQEQEKADRVKFEKEAEERAAHFAKLDAERQVKEAAERAHARLEEEVRRERERKEKDAADRKAEEEARPDTAKIKAFGEELAAIADGGKLSWVKSAKAVAFANQITADLAAIITKCRGYKTR